MNTERDNFHDWARDKEDTSFSTLQRANFGLVPVRRRGLPWGRIVFWLLAIGAGLYALKHYFGA